jgi:hypothetical protein
MSNSAVFKSFFEVLYQFHDVYLSNILRKNDLIDCHCNFPDLILALKKTEQQKYKLYLQLLWKRRGILHYLYRHWISLSDTNPIKRIKFNKL